MLTYINSILWIFATLLIISSGLYFTKKLNFPQLKIKKLASSLKPSKTQPSPIKTLFLTLAGRIGVGSIAGVALAIYLAGPGTIFWMWIFALLASPLAYTETLLALKYQDKQKIEGGPFYYIKNKHLAITYAIIILISYLIGFIPIQSNTLTHLTQNINPTIIGISLALISFICINGGINKIINITNKLVPIMTLIYTIIALIIIITNLQTIPTIFTQIITSAFQIKPFLTSFLPLITISIQRAIFANEAGLGITAIASAAKPTNNPVKTAYTQILGIYITTILICTETALIILLSDYQSLNILSPNGIEITSYAFTHHFQNLGTIILEVTIFFFSLSTILTGHYYCQTSLNFLTNTKTNIITILTPISVLLGSLISPTTIWTSIDSLISLLAIINITSLLKQRKEIVKYHKKYDRI